MISSGVMDLKLRITIYLTFLIVVLKLSKCGLAWSVGVQVLRGQSWVKPLKLLFPIAASITYSGRKEVLALFIYILILRYMMALAIGSYLVLVDNQEE